MSSRVIDSVEVAVASYVPDGRTVHFSGSGLQALELRAAVGAEDPPQIDRRVGMGRVEAQGLPEMLHGFGHAPLAREEDALISPFA